MNENLTLKQEMITTMISGFDTENQVIIAGKLNDVNETYISQLFDLPEIPQRSALIQISYYAESKWDAEHFIRQAVNQNAQQVELDRRTSSHNAFLGSPTGGVWGGGETKLGDNAEV